MTEPELPSVQHLARRGWQFLPVERVANDGMAEVVQVHSDLVSAPAVYFAFYQAHAAT